MKTLLFTLLWTLPTLLIAAQFPMKNYGNSDGLPQSQILSLSQDDLGILCIGTIGGVSIYDGAHFESFNRKSGLPSLEITALSQAGTEKIWIGTDQGLVIYERFTIHPTFVNLAITDVRSYGEDAFFTTSKGLYYLADSHLHPIIEEENLIFDVTADGTLAILEGNTLRYGKRDHLETYPLELEGEGLDIEIHGDTVYLLTGSGLYTFRENRLETLLRVGNPSAFTVTRNGDIWVAALSTLYYYTQGQWVSASSVPSPTFELINCIFVDREKNVWLGKDDGLAKIPFNNMVIYGVEDGFPNVYIRSLTPARGTGVYLGGIDLFARLDGKHGTFIPLENPLPKNGMIRNITILPDGGKLLGTHKDGIYIERDGALTHIVEVEGIRVDQVYQTVTKEEKTWIATANGLLSYCEGEFIWHNHDPRLKSPVYSIVLDSTGKMYVGTRKGILIYKDGHFVEPPGFDILKDEEINCIFFDSRNDLWIGTHGSGLFKYADGTMTVFDESNNFPNDFLWDVIEDDRGNIWACSNKGIHQLEGKRWLTLNSKDGLPGDEIFIHTAAKDTGGNLYFALPKGLLVILGGEFTAEEAEPPNILVNRISTQERSIPHPTSEVVLNPSERSFSVDFAATSLKNESSVFYSHRIKNWGSGEWSNPTNHTRVEYTALKPGSYVLELNAVDYASRWSASLSLPIVVKPYWYETLLFKSMLILLFVCTVVYLIRLRFRLLQIKQEELQTLVDERTMELQEKIAEVETLSITDTLTGLHNRRFFMEHFKQMSALGERLGKSVCFAMIDMDDFKETNDLHGHLFGDEVLKRFSNLLSDHFRTSDLVARYGGDEFIVALLTNDVESVIARFELFSNKVASANLGDEKITVNLTLSIGISILDPGESVEISFDRMASVADTALYASKSEGKNRFSVEHIQPV